MRKFISIVQQNWWTALKDRGKDLWLTLYLYFILTVIFLLISFLYSTFFSYPSIRRDCIGLFTGQPLGVSGKRKRISYRRIIAKQRLTRDQGNLYSPPHTTIHSPKMDPQARRLHFSQEATVDQGKKDNIHD